MDIPEESRPLSLEIWYSNWVVSTNFLKEIPSFLILYPKIPHTRYYFSKVIDSFDKASFMNGFIDIYYCNNFISKKSDSLFKSNSLSKSIVTKYSILFPPVFLV